MLESSTFAVFLALEVMLGAVSAAAMIRGHSYAQHPHPLVGDESGVAVTGVLNESLFSPRFRENEEPQEPLVPARLTVNRDTAESRSARPA